MSRLADEAHARWFEAHLAECARDLVIGATVYRVGWDRIEEGQVRRIDRVRHGSDQYEVEDPNGPCIRYHATFDTGDRWESQTYQWKWFFRREDAQKRLAEKLTERAKDLRAQADRCDALATATKSEAAAAEGAASASAPTTQTQAPNVVTPR